ncbi:hypothetical protein SLEP1_g59501 [Rubroshorea leprosula]|uniref:Uncharacterized protein n=1 Tax=Rubroshorea leprosula TaxID=152421 RepID=A0AAV5MW48_9ROSI|nr:hypothetical protein SLEP1_g59501 [Rubroshorea leprosula]
MLLWITNDEIYENPWSLDPCYSMYTKQTYSRENVQSPCKCQRRKVEGNCKSARKRPQSNFHMNGMVAVTKPR